MRTIAVVGASLAGVSTARALRGLGFDGRLVVIGDEPEHPYDRPPLSKGFLTGSVAREDLALLGTDEDLAIDWRLGAGACRLRAGERRIELADSSRVEADGVVLATGASPRRLLLDRPHPAGVHVLRTVADAERLRTELVPGARLVVIGAGFIGAEVAATASELGVDVTIVELAHEPMAATLGVAMARAVTSLHATHGVDLRRGVQVVSIDGTDRVTGVRLDDGSALPADCVLVGVGVVANVGWLDGSGLCIDDGVRCDGFGATELPGVVAVGDCAAWFDADAGRHRRVEHWTSARERATIAATTLLSGGTERRVGRPGYFWSDQYGHRVQFAGRTAAGDDVTVESGDVAAHDFVAVYRRGDVPVAVLAVGRPSEFMRWRRGLGRAVGMVQA